MSDFKFPDYKEISQYINKKNRVPGVVPYKTLNLKNKKHLKSELTDNLEDYLSFLSNHNLIPTLPKQIKIEYVNEDSFIHKTAMLLGRKYQYPACMNPYNNTLYISNDFKRSSDLESNQYISKARNFFNGSVQKALEYAFGHELGHFNLITKNLNNNLLPKNEAVLPLARNIEESFAEAFAIQLLLIKYPELLVSTSNFESLNNYRLQQKKNNLAKLNENTKINQLIDSYDFPEIYKNLPLKDVNGNIEKDINKIYDKCYQLALENNKEVIKEVFLNTKIKELGLSNVLTSNLEQYLSIEIKEKQRTKENFTDDDLINTFHEKMKTLGFNTKKIKGLREQFLNIKNDSTYKPT